MKPFVSAAGLGYLVCLLLSGCSSKTQDQSIISTDTQVILAIKKAQITGYELKKNYRAFESDYINAHGNAPTQITRKNWLNEFVNRTYLLADCYQKGIQNDPNLKLLLHNTICFMVIQPGGPLSRHLAKNVSVNVNPSTTPQSQSADEKQAEAIDAYLNKLNVQAQVQVKPLIVSAFFMVAKNYSYGPGHNFNEKDFQSLSDSTIATYITPTNTQKKVTVREWIQFYNSLFMKQTIAQEMDIVRYLHDLAFNAYIYQDALKLGILNDSKFHLDAENFLHTQMINKYKDELKKNSITISQHDIDSAYVADKDRYVQATEATLNLYYFKDKKNAMSCFIKLRQNTIEPQALKGLLRFQKNLNVNHQIKKIPADVVRKAFELKKNQPSLPLQIGEQYLVIYKTAETGKLVRPLPEVSAQVQEHLLNTQLQKQLQNHVSVLKRLYKIQRHTNLEEVMADKVSS